MTRFNHQKRSGKHKAPKSKPPRQPLGIGRDVERLYEHRHLEALRHPTRARLAKLAQAKRARST